MKADRRILSRIIGEIGKWQVVAQLGLPAKFPGARVVSTRSGPNHATRCGLRTIRAPNEIEGGQRWPRMFASPRRHGLRREAQRHAAFVRVEACVGSSDLRAGESGVAAPALPPQSKNTSAFVCLTRLLSPRKNSFQISFLHLRPSVFICGSKFDHADHAAH